jgi:RNA polymerase sigma factor (sigma-70 family)
MSEGERPVGLPVEQLPDESLLAGFSAGDEELTVAFVRRFQSKVFGVALAVVGEVGAAEDIAQQAFERAWRHGRAYDQRRGSVVVWLSAITRNLAIDTMRVRRPFPVDPEVLMAQVGSAADNPEHLAVLDDAAGDLRAALRRLPAEQARAIVLAGIAGLSASQVAAREGIPLGTAKTRIRTAMHHLRDVLVKSGADHE